jgi:hypothetical protein
LPKFFLPKHHKNGIERKSCLRAALRPVSGRSERVAARVALIVRPVQSVTFDAVQRRDQVTQLQFVDERQSVRQTLDAVSRLQRPPRHRPRSNLARNFQIEIFPKIGLPTSFIHWGRLRLFKQFFFQIWRQMSRDLAPRRQSIWQNILFRDHSDTPDIDRPAAHLLVIVPQSLQKPADLAALHNISIKRTVH